LFAFVFTVIYLAFPLLYFFTWKAAGKHYLEISMTNIVFLFIFMFTYFGFPILFFQWDEYRVNIGITNQSIIMSIFLLSAMSLWLYQLGVIFARDIFFKRSDVVPLDISVSEISRSRHVLVFTLPVLVLVIQSYINSLDEVALFIVLFGGESTIEVARSNMTNAFSGSYHWYALIIHELATLLSFACYALWYTTRKLSDLVLLIIYVCICIFSLTISGQKAPVVFYIMGLALTHLILIGKRNMPIKAIILGTLVSFMFLILLYILFMGSNDVLSASRSAFSRAFAGNLGPLYFYYEYIPDVRNYLFGATMPNPAGILPYEPISLAKEVYNWVYVGSSDTVGSTPGAFWADAYANFSYPGVVLISFILGIYIGIISAVSSRNLSNPVLIGFYVWLIFWVKDISLTSFWIVIINVKFTLVILSVLAVNRIYLRTRLKGISLS
jgi:oligosaccharide repeat unit polymerase